VGPGGSQDAEFALRASVPAGTYHVACDAVITASVDVSFALIWRRGVADMPLATWVKHWDPLPSGFFAQPYELDVAAPAIDFQPGDQLVFRYMGPSPDQPNNQAFIPNGDGARSNGRIPSIVLPQCWPQ
jgi:hypothetical protein